MLLTSATEPLTSVTTMPIGMCASTESSWARAVRSASNRIAVITASPAYSMHVSIVAMSSASNGSASRSRVTVTTPWIGSLIGNGKIARLRNPNRSMYG